MYDSSSATHFDTLSEGHTYRLSGNGSNSSEDTFSLVEFVCYDTCPAMVIVRNTA